MKLTVKDIVVLSLLGSLMFCSKLLTEFLPNIHFIAMLTIAYTVVYRGKALYAVFVFIMLTGLFNGFGLWWFPYLYLWPILWGAAMLLPVDMPKRKAVPVYMAVACLHGLLYGTMYAPFQALAFGLSFEKTVAWVIAGLPWDLVHGVGNMFAALLTVPVITVLKRAAGQAERS